MKPRHAHLLEDLIVLDLSLGGVVDRDHGLVLAVFLVSMLVLHGAPVAGVVHEERVASLSSVYEPPCKKKKSEKKNINNNKEQNAFNEKKKEVEPPFAKKSSQKHLLLSVHSCTVYA